MNKKSIAYAILAIVIIILTINTLLYIIVSHIEKARDQASCQTSLSQIAKGLSIYQLDFGKQQLYPQKDGQGFLLALYKTKILIVKHIYTCGSTQDYEQQEQLENAPDNGDSDGPVSYAGRKNSQHNVYPGIFKPDIDTTTTPIVSDDFGAPYNHEDEATSILFLDFHIDFKRKSDPDFPDLDVLTN
ncbi:hypothetical protein [Candidatus Uabimicrobium sp. HlEnr_7]|uniref:hypothetical protein n=1 Tax=Candidatus Uabimicrobium helgolandensis TaxID=3095367 RepID=UPI00355917D8